MKTNFGYVRGNVANHQDFDVFKEIHSASDQEINVSCICTGVDQANFRWDPSKIRFHKVENFQSIYNEYDILDTSEFYRDYSIDIIENFHGKKSVTVFDNLPFGISNGNAGVLSEKVDIVIARSPMISNMLELEGVPKSKIKVIPSAVDPNLFRPGILTNQTNTVLFVGRLVPEKGLWDLIIAMTGMVAELKVIGSGDMSPYIDLADRCSVNLNYIGPCYHEELANEMRNASLLVVPSIPKITIYNSSDSWVEQFGVVLLEGMASGLPVIASDTGSTRDIIIDGKTGFLFPPRSWDILRHYIIMLMDNFSMRNEMGCRGRERVKELFSSEVVGKKLAEVYLA